MLFFFPNFLFGANLCTMLIFSCSITFIGSDNFLCKVRTFSELSSRWTSKNILSNRYVHFPICRRFCVFKRKTRCWQKLYFLPWELPLLQYNHRKQTLIFVIPKQYVVPNLRCFKSLFQFLHALSYCRFICIIHTGLFRKQSL